MKKILIILCLFFIGPVFAEQNPDIKPGEKINYINLEWWKNFNDEFLNSHLVALYEKNYDLKNAALKIKENEQMVKMQFANELPAVNLSGTLSRDFQAPMQKFGDMQIPKYSQNNYNLPITAGYEVDIWGKNRLQTKSKKEQLEIVKQAERATYISLTSDFASDYFNLIKADKLIDIQNELIKLEEEILQKTQEKYKAGLCSIDEVLEEEKNLTLLKEEYNLHIQTRDVLLNGLKVYLSDLNTEISRNNYENVVLINNISSKYDSSIVENRPDYLQEEANLKSIGFDIRAAKREFLPNFTIFGQIGLNAYQLSSLFKSPSQFFAAGILPNFDIFSGGAKRALLKMKKYQYEEALNDYQKTYLTGIMEINSGLIEYKTSLKNYNEAKNRMDVESKLYSIAKDKEKIGSASKLEVLHAKQRHLAIQKEEVSDKIASIIATIGLYKTTGGVNLYKIEKL